VKPGAVESVPTVNTTEHSFINQSNLHLVQSAGWPTNYDDWYTELDCGTVTFSTVPTHQVAP